MLCFFFFKQKTAYEMRISDWSSDVCSSDLVDIVFANEEEVCSLYDAADFDAALQAVRAHCEVAALTRSEKGAVIVAGDAVHVVDAAPVEAVIDTTGAGDLFAAGLGRKGVVEGKGVLVRVDVGGCRIL